MKSKKVRVKMEGSKTERREKGGKRSFLTKISENEGFQWIQLAKKEIWAEMKRGKNEQKIGGSGENRKIVYHKIYPKIQK